ncbi:hypothetical protein ACFOY2_40680 [Nonomuraea purpurea]|uniref:Secreted protein n=1 Tax=Nonomuraea purpurea TaxID=1849276 RepID=A0ABV8GMW9_9ACTN
MIKRMCATAVVMAAAIGGALLAVPAHADDGWSGPWVGNVWSGNASGNSDSSQSGNNFGDVVNAIRGGHGSTNVNNVNGIASTATNGSLVVTYVFD